VTARTADDSFDDKAKFIRITLALVVTAVLVGCALLVGGREGFSNIGGGGLNAKYLPRVGEAAPDLQAYRLNAQLQPELVSLSEFKGQPSG